MASWDDSGPRLENVAKTEAESETVRERVRRLLKQLLARRTSDDWSPLPKV